MCKVILIALLAVASNNATALWWVWIDSNQKAYNYADPDTIQRNGDIVKMWTLTDLKTGVKMGDNEPFLSESALVEYDCKKELSRPLSLNFYSGNMGNGKVIHSETIKSPKWQTTLSDSMGKDLYMFACKRK